MFLSQALFVKGDFSSQLVRDCWDFSSFTSNFLTLGLASAFNKGPLGKTSWAFRETESQIVVLPCMNAKSFAGFSLPFFGPSVQTRSDLQTVPRTDDAPRRRTAHERYLGKAFHSGVSVNLILFVSISLDLLKCNFWNQFVFFNLSTKHVLCYNGLHFACNRKFPWDWILRNLGQLCPFYLVA